MSVRIRLVLRISLLAALKSQFPLPTLLFTYSESDCSNHLLLFFPFNACSTFNIFSKQPSVYPQYWYYIIILCPSFQVSCYYLWCDLQIIRECLHKQDSLNGMWRSFVSTRLWLMVKVLTPDCTFHFERLDKFNRSLTFQDCYECKLFQIAWGFIMTRFSLL